LALYEGASGNAAQKGLPNSLVLNGEGQVSFRKRVDRKLDKKEKSYETERLMRNKRSEEYDALEEVFDRSTLMIIYDFMNRGVIDEIHGVVNAGKESRVYWGKDYHGKELAIKIYLTGSSEFRKGMLQYIDADPRFKGVKHDTRSLIFAWAQKEFRNLQQATDASIRVPKPIVVRNNVLVMEFIGKDGVSAPSMKELRPKNPEKTYHALLAYLQKLYGRAELVHGDLSEYNIMIWNGKPVIFDMSQAVLISHPMAGFLLKRDLTNLNKFFSRLGISVLSTEECYRQVTGRGEN
jgi:RIO kinase 1